MSKGLTKPKGLSRIILTVPMSEILRLLLASVAEQASLSLTCLQNPNDSFSYNNMAHMMFGWLI